jgi:hypothetical protein
MNNLSLINSYKPNKYTYKGKVIIFKTNNNTYVYKNINNTKLYDYLSSRNFNNYPKQIDTNIYEYINDTNYSDEQRSQDLIFLVSQLHNKTTYYKDVTSDKYKEIYDNILSNVNHLQEVYNNYFDIFFKELYNSPSHYLFLRNYTKLKNNLLFTKQELDNWYELVKDKKEVRLSIIHNNLSLNHFLKSDKDYLISWDKYSTDIPILDIVKLYKKEYFNLNFNNLIKIYFNKITLTDDEKKLLFILLSLPDEIIFDKNEFKSCINIRNNLDYIYKTEELIRPYYLENQKEE